MYLGDIVGLIPDHGSKVSHNLFAGGGSPLQFINNAPSVKCDKAKHDKKADRSETV